MTTYLSDDQTPDWNYRACKRRVVTLFQHTYLTALMREHCGNVTRAAKTAGLQRPALQRLLRERGLKSADFRGNDCPRDGCYLRVGHSGRCGTGGVS